MISHNIDNVIELSDFELSSIVGGGIDTSTGVAGSIAAGAIAGAIISFTVPAILAGAVIGGAAFGVGYGAAWAYDHMFN